MNLGLTDMIGLAASLIFAIPLGNYAVIRLFDGEVALGVGLLGVAVAMVVLPQYFLDPGRIFRGLLSGLLPRQFRPGTPEASEAAEDGSTADDSSVADASATDLPAGDPSASDSVEK